MKTSKKKIPEEDNSSLETVDPFAGDFFNAAKPDEKENGQNEVKPTSKLKASQLSIPNNLKLDWAENLPKLTYDELEYSNRLNAIPERLADDAEQIVKKVFTDLTPFKKNQIHCKILSSSEVNLLESEIQINKIRHANLNIASKNHNKLACLAVDLSFATGIIDLILGGDGTHEETLKNFSPIESTIVEFIGIKLLSEINDYFGAAKFSLQGINFNSDLNFEENSRGTEIVLDLVIGNSEGTVTLLLPSEFLDEVSNAEQKLFDYKAFNKTIDKVDLNIKIGETKILAEDLIYLESEDVVLIENKSIDINFNQREKISVFIGAGDNYFLQGNLGFTDAEDILSSEFLFEIESITNNNPVINTPNRIKMSGKTELKEEINEQDVANKAKAESKVEDTNVIPNSEQKVPAEDIEIDEDESLSALENVLVNLKVQIAGKKISLSEIQKLRNGQIIELGCRPTDPVEIVTDNDNKPIASGELVDIEGQLGVRITKLFV